MLCAEPLGRCRTAMFPLLIARRSTTTSIRPLLSRSEKLATVSLGVTRALQVAVRPVDVDTTEDRLAVAQALDVAAKPQGLTVKPGLADEGRFSQHWSVQFWRDFQIPSAIKDENLPIQTRVQAAVQALREASQAAGVFSSQESISYWAYHIARSGFFATQGVVGLLYTRLLQSTSGGNQGVSSSSVEQGIDFGRLLRTGMYGPVTEALAMYYQDYENIKAGLYKLPWDMAPGHRQTNPFHIFRGAVRFIQEASATIQRRNKNEPDKIWLKSHLYPDYYLNTFHFQTDGWLSERSAKVYETSTETLFVGRQDAMQRQTLVPLSHFMRGRAPGGAGTQLLEVACGTGRFGTFVKDNYPRMGITQLDLSPYYLAEARQNLKYWRSMRGGPSPADTSEAEDGFLQAPAENIPLPDNSVDAVTSIYLFHEIPHAVQLKVAAEMARVVKPGGIVIITDAYQLGDRPANDAQIGRFGDFNEPYFRAYVEADLGAMFEDLGLKSDMKLLASGSKVLSFRKP